jgi:hypothetical protein
MRKLIITLTLVLYGVVRVLAQAADDQKPLNGEKTNRSGEQLKPSESKPLNNNDDGQWSHVNNDQVPARLRQTLRDSKYHGWQTLGVYQNKTKTAYYVQTGEGRSIKRYHFDNNYTPINLGTDAGGDYPATSPSKEPQHDK